MWSIWTSIPTGRASAAPSRVDGKLTRSARALGTVGVAAVLIVSGCAHPATDPEAREPGGSGSAAPAAPAGRIEFVENDYAHALAVARKEKKPLFVDAWAPWCHTCLSMKSYVFDQPEVRAQAGSFVWLSMDTETAPGQDFVQRFPMRFWPTLWVLDARNETPELKWEAAATAPELARLLRAVAAERDDDHTERAGSAGRAEIARIRGERASAKSDLPLAIASYREALASSPPGWAERPQTVEALAGALAAAHDTTACLELADAEYDKLPPGTSKANVALAAFHCAEPMPASVPSRRLEPRFELLLSIARDRRFPLLPDDRSDIYNNLIEHLQEVPAPDKALAAGKARTLAGEWSTFIDAEAASARTPAARAVFDSHRLLAYTAMGEPARAIPMLEQSERDFPEDYNPPARLARADLAVATPASRQAALAAIDRALGLVYGPRKLSLVLVKCDVLEALRDAHEMDEHEAVVSETRLLETTLAGEEANRGGAGASTTGRVRDLRERLDRLRARPR